MFKQIIITIQARIFVLHPTNFTSAGEHSQKITPPRGSNILAESRCISRCDAMQNNLSNQGNPFNFLNSIKGLRTASLNVSSIVKHIDEMRILLESKPIDILLINESKIVDTVLDNEIHISSYNIIRNDRNRNAGGVIMYLK